MWPAFPPPAESLRVRPDVSERRARPATGIDEDVHMATETINILTPDGGLVQVSVQVPESYAAAGPQRDAFSQGVDAGVHALWDALGGEGLTLAGESEEPA